MSMARYLVYIELVLWTRMIAYPSRDILPLETNPKSLSSYLFTSLEIPFCRQILPVTS
jgi:hypothetical protein